MRAGVRERMIRIHGHDDVGAGDQHRFPSAKAAAQSDEYSKMVSKPASLLVTSAPAIGKTNVAQG